VWVDPNSWTFRQQTKQPSNIPMRGGVTEQVEVAIRIIEWRLNLH
jgi:hypothetical protein